MWFKFSVNPVRARFPLCLRLALCYASLWYCSALLAQRKSVPCASLRWRCANLSMRCGKFAAFIFTVPIQFTCQWRFFGHSNAGIKDILNKKSKLRLKAAASDVIKNALTRVAVYPITTGHFATLSGPVYDTGHEKRYRARSHNLELSNSASRIHGNSIRDFPRKWSVT